MNDIYDLIIVGAGPAGLAAALYAGRARMKALLIEKSKDGGKIVVTSEVENYPGGIDGETGSTLTQRMSQQVDHFGCARVADEIVGAELEGDVKKLVGKKGEYLGKAVILAPGARPRPIGCPGEREFTGKGVSYCATCDGALFEDLEIFVVGGGDSALEETLFLTRFARKVTVIHRSTFRAAKSIQEKVFANEKVSIKLGWVIEELMGEGLLSSMRIKNLETGETEIIEADEDDGTFGVFVFIGLVPQTAVFEGKIELDKGYIVTDEKMRTSLPGVYAAGDVRVKDLRQVVTAVADGAIAATQAEKYIEGLH